MHLLKLGAISTAASLAISICTAMGLGWDPQASIVTMLALVTAAGIFGIATGILAKESKPFSVSIVTSSGFLLGVGVVW